ncbi:MAG: class I SAM-dependent methyltransferase [Acidimicrobiales bacterium]
MGWDGDAYQARIDNQAASGKDMHGEASLVMVFAPESVLDAGCGTGRVALELARRGVAVVGVDRDPSMLATARERSAAGSPVGTNPEWVESDLATMDLGREFDVVLMAGNVLLFVDPGTEAAVVAACARHLRHGSPLVTGFELTKPYKLADYDRDCAASGLQLVERYATWQRDPYEGGEYAVSVHRAAMA